MKKLLFLFVLMLLPALVIADGTENGGLVPANVDPMESLYGEWRLVGWNDGGVTYKVDASYVSEGHLTIEIPKEGYVMAYSMVNEIFVGLLTLSGNEMIFDGKMRGVSTKVYCDVKENVFFEDHICDIKSYQLDGKQLRLYFTDNDYFVFTSDINDCEVQPEDAYRPFVEDGKVWKVGLVGSGNPVQLVEYYYFDGDTIIDGRACKKMMCQRYVSPDYPDYDNYSQWPSQSYVGAWYEEDKKVYFYDASTKQLGPRRELMYDFSANANDTLMIGTFYYVIGSRQTGSVEGFKGAYRNVRWCDGEDKIYSPTWLEGVGSIDSPTVNVYSGYVDPLHFLMSCTVGDEVIYFVDAWEDGTDPEFLNARKQRIDFTHTVKIKPKSRMMRETAQSLYGEYGDLQLSINLNPLSEAYLVSITDESGRIVYEKTVNAGSIVGLNVDISTYAKGHYTVTVENDHESFIGQFETQATGIAETVKIGKLGNKGIFNLQGQRLNSLQRGLNIVNGHKVCVNN